MTGRVADAQQQRFVVRARLGKCFLGPGVPVDGIVSVLQKIRAGLVDQTVSVLVFSHISPTTSVCRGLRRCLWSVSDKLKFVGQFSVLEPVGRFLCPLVIW